MNLQSAVSIYGGGPGSGCNGPNCGRKVSDILKEHDRIKDHNLRKWATSDNPVSMERMYRMQKIALRSLADRMESSLGKSKAISNAHYLLDEAEKEYVKDRLGDATNSQEHALQILHGVLKAML